MADEGDTVAMPKVVCFLSSLLHRLSVSNDHNLLFQNDSSSSSFSALTRPSISIRTYLRRIFKYASCSPSCFIVAYVYLDRFLHRSSSSSSSINSFNVHRLLITTVLVAAKFLDDLHYNNAYYAKVGGISGEEMNGLEVELLFGLRFNLNVTPTTFYTYCSFLQKEMHFADSSPESYLPQPHSFTEEDSTTNQKKQMMMMMV